MRIIKLHKRADRYTLAWLGFAILLLVGFQFVLDRAGIESADRTGAMLLLALVVLLAAIWQAVGLGIARVHVVMRDKSGAMSIPNPFGSNQHGFPRR